MRKTKKRFIDYRARAAVLATLRRYVSEATPELLPAGAAVAAAPP
jgi:hypothetical protein